MKLWLSFVVCILLINACSQSGGLANDSNRRPSGISSSSSGNSSSSNSSGNLSGIAMRYKYPHIPSEAGAEQFYLTTFSDVNLGNVKPKEDQKTLSAKIPPQELKIDTIDKSDGSKYCFSNDKFTGGPTCAKAATAVVNHIKAGQDSPSGQHPVFISALQFNFRNAPASAGGTYSEVNFTGAKVVKAPIVFDRNTGLLATIESQHLLTLSYGNAGGNCNIDNINSVGFKALNANSAASGYLEEEYYLSGIWSFERSGRQIFGNETTTVIEPRLCESSGQQYFCNLFADKVNVWHAVMMPLLYTNGRVNHRQYPNQIISSNAVSGAPASALSTFGRYASNSTYNYINVPTGAAATAVIGKTDNAGNEIANWQNYFIRELCLSGTRRDRDANGNVVVTPLIQAMRFELRSPYIKKFR